MTDSTKRFGCAVGLLMLFTACSGERVDSSGPGRVDCASADTTALSTFVVDPFQRDLAIDTPKRVTEHLDGHPELICRTLHSERYGDLSPIAYAAGHRPDSQHLFPLLIERGARADDALAVAVWRGDSRVVPWLLEHGVDPNTESALVLAAYKRDTLMVERLLAAGADPDVVPADTRWVDGNGRSALHYAAFHGLDRMIEALLDAGADINAASNLGRTPLAEAVHKRHTGAVQLLFDRGAAPNRMREEDLEKLRRLAARYHMTEILAFLG